MDVINLNFLELLPKITEAIRECDFIAIDTELSGLMRELSSNRFDLPAERFAQKVKSSRGYSIIQFGLSCFKCCGPLHYTNQTYNFYIFPQPNEFYGDINRTISLQAHAIQFLIKNNFDFNKLFKHGVSYLNFEEKKALTAQLKSETRARSRVELNSKGLPKFVPNQLSDNCVNWLNKVKTFVADRKAKHSAATAGGIRLEAGDNTLAKSDGRSIDPADTLELRDCCTNHKRNTMTRVLESLSIHENLDISSMCDGVKNERYLVVNYIDKQIKERRQMECLSAAKGFLEVLECVIHHQKPLVGHNLALDLIKIISQFIEPLSEDYHSFKETCHSLFPLIYDTKYIAHSVLDPETLTNNQSRLNDLYCQLRDSDSLPKIMFDRSDELSDDNQQAHQAGYDAYMTGCCFLILSESYMREVRKYKMKKDDLHSEPSCIVRDHRIVSEFGNKIHLTYSYDFKYFDLNADEEEPDRNHLFYVEFPHTWCLDDLFQVFNPHGGIDVSLLSKTSALCALRDRGNRDTVSRKAKSLPSSSNYRIYSYDDYLENFKVKKNKDADCSDLEMAYID